MFVKNRALLMACTCARLACFTEASSRFAFFAAAGPAAAAFRMVCNAASCVTGLPSAGIPRFEGLKAIQSRTHLELEVCALQLHLGVLEFVGAIHQQP